MTIKVAKPSISSRKTGRPAAGDEGDHDLTQNSKLILNHTFTAPDATQRDRQAVGLESVLI
jgi:hypothetical protein